MYCFLVLLARERVILLRGSGSSLSRADSACFISGRRCWCNRLEAAHRELNLEAAIAKLYKYHLLILDDFSYVTTGGDESNVLFKLIGARYENRSLLLIANEPFTAWEKIFGGKAKTLAAVDRLVHHSHVFEMNVESYRRRAAVKARQAGERDLSTGSPEIMTAGS